MFPKDDACENNIQCARKVRFRNNLKLEMRYSNIETMSKEKKQFPSQEGLSFFFNIREMRKLTNNTSNKPYR